MSSVKTWLTKEEVLEDLAKVSGRRNVRVGNLDNSYLLKGNDPPPVVLEAADDEEMRLHFGDGIHADKDIHRANTPPDLQGITDLLRMVQGADDQNDTDSADIGQSSNCVIAISKACKLNPNVKEFIPKGASSSLSSSDISEKCSTSAVKTENSVSKSVEKTDDDTTEIVEAKDDSKSEAAKNVDEELATKLKNVISDASKSNTFEVKRQRNVAIATLLRLYATENKTTSPTKPTEPLKLITPNFFENQNSPETVAPDKTKFTSLSTTTSPRARSVPSTATGSSNDVRSEPALPLQAVAESPKPQIDPAFKKSIEKVNNWLGEAVVRKPVRLCLGPISFKKKDPVAGKSPLATATAQQTAVKSSQPNQYQPSNYAADLEKKYMERSKADKAKPKINMWTDLDIILKEKDKTKKRQAQDPEDN